MQTKDSKMSKKRLIYDAILILALLVVALSALLVLRSCSEAGSTVCVSVDGEKIMSVSLFVDAEYPILDGKNLLVVEGGEAYIKSADCPDKLCVRQGHISMVGESVICLPNRVSVTVE